MLDIIIASSAEIILVWMIGFSGDSRWLRIGGFILLCVKLLVPSIILGVRDSLWGLDHTGFFIRLLMSAVIGAYLILWAVKSVQSMPVRIALAIAALIPLWPILPLGVMMLLAPG